MSLLKNEDDALIFYREFIEPHKQARLLQVTARNKYCNGSLSRSTLILERSVHSYKNGKGDMNENSFLQQLKRYDAIAKAGLYTDPKKDDTRIPVEALVIYMTAYPLDEDDACDEFVSQILKSRQVARKQYMNCAYQVDKVSRTTEPIMTSTLGKLKSCLHSSASRLNRMLKLDIDTKDSILLANLYEAMKDCVVLVAVETRGGYHVVIERGPSCQTLWKFARDVNSTIKKDDQWVTIENGDGPMIAIPGTNQGGFTVRLATKEWKDNIAKQQDNETPLSDKRMSICAY